MRPSTCVRCRRLKIKCMDVDHALGCTACRKRQQECEYTRRIPTLQLTQSVHTSGLPPPPDAVALLKEYFAQQHVLHTIHPRTFLRAISGGRAPRSVVFVLLATVVHHVVPQTHHMQAVQVLKERAKRELASGQEATLHHAQSLLLLALLMMMDDKDVLSYPLAIASSIKMLMSFGVHRIDDELVPQHLHIACMSEPEKETLRRLFWHLYIADRAHMIYGHEPTIHDDDLCMRLIADEEEWRQCRMASKTPLFDADQVHDNTMSMYGHTLGKTYFFHCLIRLCALVGKVASYRDDMKRAQAMKEGTWKHIKWKRLHARHVALLTQLDVWWSTFPILYTDITGSKPISLPTECFYDVDWVICAQFMYLWTRLELGLLSNPHAHHVMQHKEWLDMCMQLVQYAMEKCTRPQYPVSIRVTVTAAQGWSKLIHACPLDEHVPSWYRHIETCLYFVRVYGGTSQLNMYLQSLIQQCRRPPCL